MTELSTFEEIYQMKLEQEMQEKAR